MRSGVLTFGSTFSGIDGLALGLERAGWVCKWQMESDLHATAVLADKWPDIKRYGDIRRAQLAELEPVDAVVGGFPCQPTSVAGKRRGKADDRWLWPEFARLLSVVRPRWVLLENPTGLLAFPEFGEVLGDLASLGFDAEWDAVPAAALGAPHERDRVFVVAYRARDALRGQGATERPLGERTRASSEPIPMADPEGLSGELRGTSGERPRRSSSRREAVADASSLGRGAQRPGLVGGLGASGRSEGDRSGESSPLAISDPYGGHSNGRGGDDEVGRLGIEEAVNAARDAARSQWSVEPSVGRVAHGIPARVDRLTRLGNAVVPQVAEFWGRLILTAHNRGAA